MNTSTGRLLRVRQVAEQLGVSVRTVWRIVADGELPQPVKVRGCSCWPEAVVQQYLERLNGMGATS
jgi:excisionase family DNA binding protein